ncbi:hypothetical protein EYF80_000527 [Liparis tanakae]|uniref:Uncharacterized protein n=1 Tax=Liparis tanakae TaxID=230148 RepID=A0A4Z2JG50_9TELE|nr:hypothetical protein EYF80_000527 [Liparis tanakae]
MGSVKLEEQEDKRPRAKVRMRDSPTAQLALFKVFEGDRDSVTEFPTTIGVMEGLISTAPEDRTPEGKNIPSGVQVSLLPLTVRPLKDQPVFGVRRCVDVSPLQVQRHVSPQPGEGKGGGKGTTRVRDRFSWTCRAVLVCEGGFVAHLRDS